MTLVGTLMFNGIGLELKLTGFVLDNTAFRRQGFKLKGHLIAYHLGGRLIESRYRVHLTARECLSRVKWRSKDSAATGDQRLGSPKPSLICTVFRPIKEEPPHHIRTR